MVAAARLAAYRAAMAITLPQIRAARALLSWRQADLASATGLSLIAIKNIERGGADPRVSTMDAIERAFNEAGVIFLSPDRNGGYGVRFKK